MRKIRLDIDDLAVESFTTAARDGKKRGTVGGYGETGNDECVSAYSDCATCLEGCPQESVTCFGSCRMTRGNEACDIC